MILHLEHSPKIQQDHHTKCEHEKYAYVINIINAVCNKRTHEPGSTMLIKKNKYYTGPRTTQPNKNKCQIIKITKITK